MTEKKLYVTLPESVRYGKCTECMRKSFYKGKHICIWQPKCIKWRELAKGEWPHLFMRGGYVNQPVYEAAMAKLFGDNWKQ